MFIFKMVLRSSSNASAQADEKSGMQTYEL
jgi:hypothetical protein